MCFTIVGMYAITTLHARDVALDTGRREATNLAESLAAQASDTMEAADGILLAVVDRVEREGTGPMVADGLREFLAGSIGAMPRLHALTIIDEHGAMVLDNTSSHGRPDLTYADREYFTYHRAHDDPGGYISGPFRSKTEKSWVIAVSRRLSHPDGRFAGVVVAQIAIDYFRQTYAGVDVGAAGVVIMLRDNGTVLVRRPMVESYIGRNVGTSVFFNGPLAYEMAGATMAASPLDGVLRLNAFRRLGRYPLVVVVALAEREVLAAWRANALTNLLATSAILLLMLGLASILLAQIGQRQLAEETLARQALVDGLTGIANRRRFDDVFEREWYGAVRDVDPLSVLMIDADNFKAYNDTYGHQHGDDVLRAIAATIVKQIRPRDVGARYGGEEFCVVLPAADFASAFKVAERIREEVAALNLPHSANPTGCVTVSIGVASTHASFADDRAALLATADRALYAAKRAGRDCSVILPHPDPTVAGLDRTAIDEFKLLSALSVEAAADRLTSAAERRPH